MALNITRSVKFQIYLLPRGLALNIKFKVPLKQCGSSNHMHDTIIRMHLILN